MKHDDFSPFLLKIKDTIFDFFVAHKTYSSLLLVGVVTIFVLGVISKPEGVEDSYKVIRRNIIQVVPVSGSVQSAKDASLAFQVSGQVAFVGVKVGDVVESGKTLATLQAGEAQANLLEAEALLANRAATLEQLKQGATKEEIALKEQVVNNTANTLDQTYRSLVDVIKNTDAITSDVVKNKFSQMFVFSGALFTLSFSSCDQTLQSSIEVKRTKLENVLADFQKSSGAVTPISSRETLDVAFKKAYNAALLTNEVVNEISQLLLASCSTPVASLDEYRTNLSTVKTNMNTLFADLSTKRNTVITAENSYAQAVKDLELAKAGTNPYTVKAQTALLSQAEAQVKQARAALQKTIIKAPFKGTVSLVDISEGESVAMNSTVIRIIAEDAFEVEAKIPEIDIAKVKVGSLVNVTLDAYGNDTIFEAKVTRINPTATTEGSVPSYKAIVTFSNKDTRIRQGMTANMNIVTAEKTSVYAVPSRFVTVLSQTKGQVVVLSKNKEETRDVDLGLRGEDGLIEILNGVFDGDVLLSPETKIREAQKITK